MPSPALAQISDSIEHEMTDSFGKFYLYASLLNVLAQIHFSLLIDKVCCIKLQIRIQSVYTNDTLEFIVFVKEFVW